MQAPAVSSPLWSLDSLKLQTLVPAARLIRPKHRARCRQHAFQAAAKHDMPSVSSLDQQTWSRRTMLGMAGLAMCSAGSQQHAAAAGIDIVTDNQGFGQRAAQLGDLVLVHYTGSLQGTGAVFDSTKGEGLTYRDGGFGVYRPSIIRLGGDPVPGVCAGLKQAVLGMRIGGRRTVVVPAELGFGTAGVRAPYAAVPGGSTLVYDVELLRLSALGPDELTRGIDRCSSGGASASTDNCRNIKPLEVF